jgi:hypothetical protein
VFIFIVRLRRYEMPLKRITITLNMAITMTVNAVDTPDGAVVIDVVDVMLPSPTEVMEALDSDDMLDTLDQIFKSA